MPMPRLFRLAFLVLLCLRFATASDTPVDLRLRQIQMLIQTGSWEDARKELPDALAQFPQEPSLHNFMGVVEAQANNYPSAETCSRKALELSPRFTGAAMNLGRLYQENAGKDGKAHSKALQVYQQILACEPANTEAIYQAAVLNLEQGDYQALLTRYARLPAEVQQRPQALAVRCASLAGLRKNSKAGKAAETLLAHPDLAELEGNREEAYRLIQLSLKANPDFADALVELGQLEMRLKNYPAAEKALQRAVELEPDSFQANMHLLRLFQATYDPRADSRETRFDEISKKRAEREASLMRTIEVRPY